MAGWGGAWTSLLRRLKIPQDAGPSDPQIVLGPDVPAELTAFYPPNSIVAALLYRIDANRYAYSAVITDVSPYRVDGMVNLTRPNPVTEMMAYESADGGGLSIVHVGGLFGKADQTLAGVIDALAIHATDASSFEGAFDLGPGPVRYNGLPTLYGFKRTTNVTVPNGVSTFTQPVAFPSAFPAGVTPHVTCNINNGAGTTARWVERAYNVTNSGFTMFLFSGNAANTTGFTVDVTWSAVAEAV